MHYLYRHIRLDKNEPFYIGIGTISEKDSKSNKKEIYYRRAFLQRKRTTYWNNIIAKSKYRVDIILESTDYNFIKNKEIEFIKLYGRKNLKEGSLVNLTDGGDGTLGIKFTEEVKKKMSKSRTGMPTSDLQKKVVGNMYKNKFGILHNKSKSVYCVEDDIYFGSISELSRFVNRKPSSIYYYIKNNIKYKNKTYIYCNKHEIDMDKLWMHFEKKV